MGGAQIRRSPATCAIRRPFLGCCRLRAAEWPWRARLRCSCRKTPGTVPKPTAITTRMRPSATIEAPRGAGMRADGCGADAAANGRRAQWSEPSQIRIAPGKASGPAWHTGARSWSPRSRSTRIAGARSADRVAHAGLTAARVGPPAAWSPESPPRGARAPRRLEPGIEPERIANRFARSRNGAAVKVPPASMSDRAPAASISAPALNHYLTVMAPSHSGNETSSVSPSSPYPRQRETQCA